MDCTSFFSTYNQIDNVVIRQAMLEKLRRHLLDNPEQTASFNKVQPKEPETLDDWHTYHKFCSDLGRRPDSPTEDVEKEMPKQSPPTSTVPSKRMFMPKQR